MKINSFRDDLNDVPATTKTLLVIAESLTTVFVLAERSVCPPKIFMLTIKNSLFLTKVSPNKKSSVFGNKITEHYAFS